MTERKMKESVLVVLILFASLQHAIAYQQALLYLPREASQWTHQIDSLISVETGLSKDESVFKQCGHNPQYNDHILNDISEYLVYLWNEIGKVRKFDYSVLNSSNFELTYKEYKIREKVGEVQKSFKSLIDKLPTSNELVDPTELCNYAFDQIDRDNLKQKIDNMRDEILNKYTSGPDYLTSIVQNINTNKKSLCGKGHGGVGYIYSIYSEIIRSEIEGYATTVFSLWYLHRFDGKLDGCKYKYKETPVVKLKTLQNDFQQRIIEYSEKFLSHVEAVPNHFYACDPETLERDVTYVELQGAMQIVVMLPPYLGYCNSRDFVGLDEELYCMKFPWNYRCRGIPRPCLGHIHDCQVWENAKSVCVTDFPNPRRYTERCRKNKYNLRSGGASVCRCQCVDNKPDSWSTHLVNLRPVLANVEQNMAITGIRMVVEYNILQFQIQQGKMLRNWQVEDVAWKEIDDISEEIYAHRTGKYFQGVLPDLSENVDYRIISENEAIDLDEIRVPQNHVLTGVKFHYGTDEHLQIAVMSTEYDPVTGERDKNVAWNIFLAEEKLRVEAHGDDIVGVANSGKGYIKFHSTDWQKDLGQVTVPLFDAIPIETDPPRPLAGLGIYYKSVQTYGVLSLKLLSIDYAAYIRESLNHLKN